MATRARRKRGATSENLVVTALLLQAAIVTLLMWGYNFCDC